ncbi:MAG: asparagine synthase-related protein [Gemmatimonadota bacterium]
MAVIAGVWQRNGSRVPVHSAANLLDALHAPFHSVLSAFSDERLAFGAKSLLAPAIVSHSGIVVALTGRLDGDLQAADVLDAYMDEGNGGLHHLSGDYALAIHDPHRHTLILLRDPVGTQPLYYAVNPERFAFGSQIKAVLAAGGIRATPNRAALAHLLIAGAGTPRGETCFAGVRALPPGCALFVTPDSESLAAHAELRPIVPTPLRNFEQCAAAFRRAFCSGVTRRVSRSANTAILVSGGVDSAAIAGAAAAAAPRDTIVAISYGRSDGGPADERRYIGEVIAGAGVRGVHFELEPIGFPDAIEADVRAGETPLVDDVPGTLARAAAAARAHGAHHLLLGTWGDQVLFPFPPPYMLELLRRGRLMRYAQTSRVLAEWLADVPRARLHRALISQAARGFLPVALLDRVRRPRATAAVFDLLGGLRVPRRRAATSHAAAIRREVTGPISVDAMEGTTKWGWAHGLETQLPYLDADLIQLLFAIEPQHALHGGVPKALLRSGMAGLVPAAILERRDKGDYTVAIMSEFAAAREQCIARLENGARLVRHRLMSRAAADRTLARLRTAGEIELGLLSSLVGLDAWLEVFFDDPARIQA